MAAFTKEIPRLLAHMLTCEAPQECHPKCKCGHPPNDNLYRCQDCFCDVLHCSRCIVESHRNHPLHWIDRWTGNYFEKQSLSSIGFTLYLGHDGFKCPHTPSTANHKPLSFTIVHGNGIHDTEIGWCFCAGAGDHVDQLMLARLFPATTDKPQTAFSFSMLREYTVHKLQSKKAAYDYFTSLRRLTDGVFTYDTPVSTVLYC